MSIDVLAENLNPVSDLIPLIRGCDCAFCGRGFSADDPLKTDGTTSLGTVDTIGVTIGAAGTVTVGGSVSGTVNPNADRDWYAITLTAGQAYTFNLNGTAGAMSALFDPYLRLLNASGTVLALDDDGGPGYNSQISYTPTTTGTYYLGAGSYGDTGVGSYTLSAAASVPSSGANPLDAIDWGSQVTLNGGVIYVYFATSGQTIDGQTADRSWTS